MRRFLFNIAKSSTLRSGKQFIRPLIRKINNYTPKYQFCWINDLLKNIQNIPRIEMNMIHNAEQQYSMHNMINT